MTIKRNVQLPRSNREGVKPRAEELDYGNLAVNFFAGDEFLSTKNSSNEVVVFPSKNYIEKHPFSSLTIDNLAVSSGASISGNSTIDGSLRVNGDTYLGAKTYVKSGNNLVTIENLITETAKADGNNYVTGGSASNNTITLKRKDLADITISDVVTTDKVASEVESASNGKFVHTTGDTITGTLKFTHDDAIKIVLDEDNIATIGGGSTALNITADGIELAGTASDSKQIIINPQNSQISLNKIYFDGSSSIQNLTDETSSKTKLNITAEDEHLYYNGKPIANVADSRWEAGTGTGAVLLKGSNGKALGELSVSEGTDSTAYGTYSHAEGNGTNAVGESSHAEGDCTNANGYCSHAEGQYTNASGSHSHAEGSLATANGDFSHAEGDSTIASGFCSHAEGNCTNTVGDYSHAEGDSTFANGYCSHAEGKYTKAVGECSHAEGSGTSATSYSHSEGNSTIASGSCSHAEGFSTTANGKYSHAEGNHTIAMNEGEHACGSYNRSASGSGQVFSVGAGTSDNNRVNSFYVKNDGTIGSDLDLSISGNSKITLSTASDKLIMSGGTITTNCTMTTGAYFTTSDKRLKTNIVDVTEDEIEKAKKVNLKSFNLKRDGKKHFGVVAQEVETAGLAELVNTDSEGMKSVDYTSLLILKIAELEKEIKDLKNQINKK